MKYRTALLIAAAAVLGCSYVGGASSNAGAVAAVVAMSAANASARECLPGMDPAKDNCQVTEEQEPAPNPALQDIDQTYYCIELQKIAVKIAELRDQGAGQQAVINVLVNDKQQKLIWVAKQVYWPQSADLSPKQIGLRVWMRCNSGEYPGVNF